MRKFNENLGSEENKTNQITQQDLTTPHEFLLCSIIINPKPLMMTFSSLPAFKEQVKKRKALVSRTKVYFS